MDHPHAKTFLIAIGATISFALSIHHLRERSNRTRKISKTDERVLILGASSGIGRAMAHLYSQRGARLCVVGRRSEIDVVEQECKTIQRIKETPDDRKTFSFKGDIANPEDMITLRDVLAVEWQGIDTVILTAGVSSLQPLLSVANLKHDSDHVELDGVQRVFDVAQTALRSNYLGPLVSAVTFIPLLLSTSTSPSILLLSSLGAVIPAPTRSIYVSTKAASLLLYQSLAIEHPTIKFSIVIPNTVKGDFRSSAVDGMPIRDNTEQKGMDKGYVARKCIEAIDREKKHVFLPGYDGVAHLLYWICPWIVEQKASKKYHFVPKAPVF